MPCFVLGPRNVPDKCSWWADGVFQSWCWFCIKVTDPSILCSAGSSLGCCAFCQRPHKTKRSSSPPSACALYSAHSWESFSGGQMGLYERRNDPLLIAPQAKHSLYTQGKYLFTTFHIYCSCSLCSIYCSIWLVLWCHLRLQHCVCTSGAAQAAELISFMRKRLNETKWTDLAVT